MLEPLYVIDVIADIIADIGAVLTPAQSTKPASNILDAGRDVLMGIRPVPREQNMKIVLRAGQKTQLMLTSDRGRHTFTVRSLGVDDSGDDY